MKESDAKLKWCPMARCAGNGGAANRDNQSGWAYPEYLCIGSACMMWEAYYKIENGQYVKENGEFVLSDNGDCGLKSKDLECNQ